MTCTIPPDLELFVRDELSSGRFPCEEQLITAALRLLRESRDRHDALRREVTASLAEADAGRLHSLDTAATKAEGRRRLAAEG